MESRDKQRSGWAMRTFGAVCLVLSLAGIAWLGWMWLSEVKLSDVKISGEHEASSDSLRALARIQIGEPLYEIKPAFVADRVERHPWVEKAYVTRLPTGHLTIDVTEREPALLYMDAEHGPFYIDADGYQMRRQNSVYDVPILTGVALEYQPLSPIEHGQLHSFLEYFSHSEAAAIISEVDLSGDEVMVYTISGDTHGAIPVRLGKGQMDERLSALHLFWSQAIKGQPDKVFEMVDLRFDGQVVARELRQGTTALK